MANNREISGNLFRDNTTIFQGDFNGTFNIGLPNEDVIFLEKISKTDPFYDRKRILDLKGPFLQEACEWILNHEDFQKWRNTRESGALWIKGDPGKGKTMLLCGIINDLEKNPGINSNFCYFFFQATDNRINSAVAAVGGLIFSLLEQRQNHLQEHQKLLEEYQNLREEYQKLFGEYQKLLKEYQKFLSGIRKRFEGKMSQLSGPNAWQVLCDMFEAVAKDQAFSNVVCVVDALDECEHDVKLLLSFIAKTSHQVKWLFTSRNIKEIEQGLRSIDDSRRLVLELKRNAECISRSVDAYIDDSIRDIEALTDDEELRIKTVSTLKFKADGTFLWVSLVVEQLRYTDRRNIEEVLDELPVGLENLYDLIMRRIIKKPRKKDQNVCQILLSIVTTAERPLRLEELLEFIKLQWKEYKANYDVRDMKDIVKDCGSFLSIKDDTIYFVHQSVKDYMVGKVSEIIFPSGVAYQHSEMFKNSLRAMSCILTYDVYNIKDPKTDWTEISRPNPDPLAPIVYCCTFWVEHLAQSCQLEKSNIDEHLKENGILHCFLKSKFLCWLESLILLGAFLQGPGVLNKLRSIIARCCEYTGNQYLIDETRYAYGERRDHSLEQFIDDAWQFIHDCKKYVRNFPLQLYYAAFVFGDSDNTINKIFRQAIHAKFGYLPVFTNEPRRRYSRLQVIKSKQRFTSLRFSPDSSLLCLLHYDTVSLWRPKSGTRGFEFQLNLDKEGMEIDSEPDTSHHIAFSSDSSQLISALSKGVVQIWSINNGIQIEHYRLKFVDRTERVIALSRNGDLAASVTAGDIGQLTIWTTKTGAQKQSIRLGNAQNIFGAAFSSDYSLIALIDEAGVAIYSVQTGKDIKHLQRPLQKQLADHMDYPEYKTQTQFSPNSETFAYVYDKQNIELWCTKTWTIKHRVTLENTWFSPAIDQFAFSPDSATFLIGWNGTKSSWLLATGDENGGLVIWRVDAAKTLTEASNSLYSKSIEHISSDSKLVAAMDHQGYEINIIAAENGKVVRVIKSGISFEQLSLRNRSLQVRHAMCIYLDRYKPCFSTNLDLVARQVGAKGDVQIWDVNTGKVMQVLQDPGSQWTKMAFSYDSKYLVAGYEMIQPHVRIWCVKSGENLYKFDCGHLDEIHAVAISLDSKFVASSDLHKVQIWEPRTGLSIHEFQEWEFEVEKIAFSADSTFLAVISKERDRRKVEIWKVATGTSAFCVEAHDPSNVLSFDPVTGDVLTDRCIFKNSSWGNWDELPRHDYPLWHMDAHRHWIVRNGEGIIYIPKEFRVGDGGPSKLSDALMAYTSDTDQVIILKFPDGHGLNGTETKVLDSKNSNHRDLGLSDAPNVNLGDLVGEDCDSSTIEKRTLGRLCVFGATRDAMSILIKSLLLITWLSIIYYLS